MIVATLYVGRSIVRGSWRLEMPMDAVVLVMIAVVMAAVARLRAIASSDEDDAEDTAAHDTGPRDHTMPS